jgi:hypothetical protein
MPPETAVSIVDSVIRGRVLLHYRTLGGRLMRTTGAMEVPGAAQLYGVGIPIGRRRTFRYSPWASSELD